MKLQRLSKTEFLLELNQYESTTNKLLLDQLGELNSYEVIIDDKTLLNLIAKINVLDHKEDFNLFYLAYDMLNGLQYGKRRYGKSAHRDLLNVVIDLETLGTDTFSGSPVCTISTASFYFDEGKLNTLVSHTGVNYTLDNYSIDEETYNWWNKQPAYLFNAIVNNGSNLNLTQGITVMLLELFKAMIISGCDDLVVYGNSSLFDIEMLNNHLRHVGAINTNSSLFNHYKERDARPLLGLNLYSKYDCEQFAINNMSELGISSDLQTYHHSLFDVLYEGKALIDTLELINLRC